MGALAGPTRSYPPISKVEAGNRKVSDADYNDPGWQTGSSANFLNSKGCNIPTPVVLDCAGTNRNYAVGETEALCVFDANAGGALRADDLYQCTLNGASTYWKFIKAGKAPFTPGCP